MLQMSYQMEQILEDVKEHVLEAKHKVKKLFFDSSLCVVVCLYSATRAHDVIFYWGGRRKSV